MVVNVTREADVVRVLVEMADTLVDDYDVVDLLTGLADRSVSMLGASAAGVMLASPAGSLGLVASSSEAMRLLELFELQSREGPCLDAFLTGEAVEHEVLQAGAGRWPVFSAAAVEAGFQSVVALPLRMRHTTLGALNMLNTSPAPMDEANVIVARAFADLAALSIVQHRASAEAQRVNQQLSSALWTHAREQLDVTTVIFSNRSYAILNMELERTGATAGDTARSLLNLSRPDIDFTALAAGMGVPATRALSAGEFADQLGRALSEPGPHLIEAVLPPPG